MRVKIEREVSCCRECPYFRLNEWERDINEGDGYCSYGIPRQIFFDSVIDKNCPVKK